MIGELRLKVDGMQKELHTQNKKLEDGASFANQFHNDLRTAVQVGTGAGVVRPLGSSPCPDTSGLLTRDSVFNETCGMHDKQQDGQSIATSSYRQN